MVALPASEPNRKLFTRLIEHHIRFTLAKRQIQLSKHDWYLAAALAVRDLLVEKMLSTRARFERAASKKLYYLSLEFLIGRSLENNLFNLGIMDICRDFLADNGIDLQILFDEEPDAALGNGGLGRLAACFLDSLATLELPGYAYGINYEFGLFRQEIRDGYQVERPDSWRRETSPWLVPRHEDTVLVPVYGRIDHRFDRDGEYVPMWVESRLLVGLPSDLPISGYGGQTVNFVRLYSAGASDEFDMQIFNGGDYVKAVEQKMVSETISKVLYPSDAIAAGRELRLLQEYFFVACAIRDIVRGFAQKGYDFSDFPAKVAIQLNDTHPTLAIAELMRLLMDQYDLPWVTAWEITRATFAYTNHTLMPEALERWPVGLSGARGAAPPADYLGDQPPLPGRSSFDMARRSRALRRTSQSSMTAAMRRSGWPIWRSSAVIPSTGFRSFIRSWSRPGWFPISTNCGLSASATRPTA